ncbi:MAG: hypothetical protein JSV49_08910 [Thermoplasmata archaeon]|nr:MAG: hypothetical protein JSV49_08910 [Thermoplasmata archaeon]
MLPLSLILSAEIPGNVMPNPEKPKVKRRKKLKRIKRIKRGGGAPRKKVERQLTEEDYRKSFMVEPHQARSESDQDKVDYPAAAGSEEKGEEDAVSVEKQKVTTSGKPAFGESLNVGFTGRNSRKHGGKRHVRFSKLESKDAVSGGDSGAGEGGVETMEELGMPQGEVTDLDEDSYIEWDGGSSQPERATSLDGNEFVHKELYCRNCDEIIDMKYIKYYFRTIDGKRIRVNGPFCSKLCSMEFSGT